MATPGLPLLRVEDTTAFRAEVRVDEARAAAVTPGTAVTVVFDGADTSPVAATVAEVNRAVDADSRTFLLKVPLPARPGLRSGTFVRVRFQAGQRTALTVPPAAVVRQGQVTSVFVVDGDVARLRLVRLRDTEVLAGLADGEVVVVAPPPGLADGRRVTTGGPR
jgi:RND family efflux transporter MFP subunit